jgi:hypothetical protein
MKPATMMKHVFVEHIPDKLEDATLYVSVTFATAVHKCFCGCGNEVVTPLSPTDWRIIFDGDSISLDPSIGNWSFDCKSHYWIEHGFVIWARRWSQEEIDAGRTHDRQAKEKYFGFRKGGRAATKAELESVQSGSGFWSGLKRWLS